MLERYDQTGGTTALTFELPELLAAVAAPIAALRPDGNGNLRSVAVNPALSALLDWPDDGVAFAPEDVAARRCSVTMRDLAYDVSFRPLRGARSAHGLVIATFTAAAPGPAASDGRELELRLQLALQAGGFGVWEYDIPAERIRYDPAYLALHGWRVTDCDLTLSALRERIHPRDRARVRAAYNQCRRGERALVRVEFRIRRRDGSYAWVEEHATVAACDEAGRPVRMIGMSTDISARKETEERLAHLALHDPLTGLPNRRALADALDRALARAQRSGLSLAVLALDLNGFKSINDRYGHPAGDAALVEIGERLRRTMRRSDAVARLGGDEFAVIAGELRGQQPVLRLARRLGHILAEPIALPAGRARVGVSIGVAFYPGDGDTPELLLGQADRALYAAKHDGVGWRLCAELPELAASVR